MIRKALLLCAAALFVGACAKKSGSKVEPVAPASAPPPSAPTANKVDPEPAPPPPAAPASTDAYVVQCGGKQQDLGSILAPIVSKMVAQGIPYAQNPANEWRDCSGNFLRLTSYLAGACPEQKANLAAPPGIRDYKRGRKNVAPNGGKVSARTTRDLAKWYYDKGNFTPIYYDGAAKLTDRPAGLTKARNQIRPGTVLWFSRGAPKKAGGVDALFNRNRAGTHINHMAVVTKVVRDEDGNVQSFEMYHGRSKGKKAAVTKHHYWDWPQTFTKDGKKYPSFGYWTQRLVGVGTVVPTR